MLGNIIEVYIIIVAYYCFHIFLIHRIWFIIKAYILFAGYSLNMLFVLFFWEVPRHFGRCLLYRLVAINPTFPNRVSARIASTFYRAKTNLLAIVRYDPVAARTMDVIGQDRATVSIIVVGFANFHIAAMRYTCFHINVLNTLSLFLYLFCL
jgi:hypothetical protein